jgi:hypothetical protein
VEIWHRCYSAVQSARSVKKRLGSRILFTGELLGLLQVDNKRVVQVLVGSTWLDAEQGTYSTKKSGNEAGFSFTDRHSGRVVSGPVASVTAVKYEPKKQ